MLTGSVLYIFCQEYPISHCSIVIKESPYRWHMTLLPLALYSTVYTMGCTVVIYVFNAYVIYSLPSSVCLIFHLSRSHYVRDHEEAMIDLHVKTQCQIIYFISNSAFDWLVWHVSQWKLSKLYTIYVLLFSFIFFSSQSKYKIILWKRQHPTAVRI